MKRISLMFFVAILASLSCNAQNILNNSKWFDGTVLYRATVKGDLVELTGNSTYEKNIKMSIRKTDGPSGEYELLDNNGGNSRWRAETGGEVRYINQQGVAMLVVCDGNGAAVWTMAKTTDNLEDCLAIQQWAENQPYKKMTDSFAMNTEYLGHFDNDELREMLRIIERAHTNSYPRNVYETFNYSLIQNELAFRSMIGGEEHDDEYEQEEGAPEGEEIFVNNEVEFINALKSGNTIVVKKGVTLNLSRVTNNKAMFKSQGRAVIPPYQSEEYMVQGRPVEYGDEIIGIEDPQDGPQLTLVNFQNLTIRGEEGTTIVCEPRYAYVLNFVGCVNVSIENLVIGHTEGGYCEGGVIGITRSRDVFINQCDLYGCGTYGIVVEKAMGVRMNNSIIRDCTYGATDMKYSTNLTFTNCDFYRNQRFTIIGAYYCNNVTFTGCRFYANKGELFGFTDNVVFDDCETQHPSDQMGSVENIVENGKASKWTNKDNGKLLKKRNIGPQ